MNSKQTKGFSLYAIHAPASAFPQAFAYNTIFYGIGNSYGFFLHKLELVYE